jgi:heme/copper-type cytochrome/quinol oxidase subunit 2
MTDEGGEPRRGTSASNSSVLGITSLVSALFAAAVFWPAMTVFGAHAAAGVVVIVAAVISVVLGVVAVVTGVVTRRRIRRGHAGGDGIAVAGIMLGILAIALPATIVGVLAYTVYSSYQEFERCVRGSGSAYPSYLCLKECPEFLDSLCRRQIGW